MVSSLDHGFGLFYDFIWRSAAVASVNLANLLEDLLAPYSQASDPERRAAQYSSNYRLAFSLLNEDSAAGNAVLDWDIRTELTGILPR